MTTLTLVTIAVIVYGIVNSRGYGRALALGGATPVGAALLVGATAVPTFYAAATGAAVGVATRMMARTRRSERSGVPALPGFAPLVAFVTWAVLVTLIAPLLFDGLPVLAPGGVPGQLTAGHLTPSNRAQIIYLVLGACVVVFLARSRWATPSIIGTTVGLSTLLSLWAYLGQEVGVPYPSGVFDNSPAFNFINSTPTGLPRFRGIFSEPAGLATTSVVTIAYMLSRAVHVTGLRRAGALVVASIAAYLAAISTSATFVVAGLALAALAAVVHVQRILLRRGPLSPAAVTLLSLAAIAAVWLLPRLADYVEDTLNTKLASSSYADRSGADEQSFHLVMQTFGMGTGLGSTRPSSFAAGLLGTVGIPGTLLFLSLVFVLIREAAPVRAYRPVIWALVGALVAKLISSPDLADTSGILWMSLGLLAHAGILCRTGAQSRQQRGRAAPHAARLPSSTERRRPQAT
ncbi:hypothetical protein ACI8AV_00850 [Geodermatophilus sp. SYSU D00804]